MAMQRLVIVRRNEFATFARLAQTFANEPNVRLVWDRRIRDRRQSSVPAAGERRRRDRRANATTTWGPDDYLLLTIAQPEETPAPGDARDTTTEQRAAITEELRRDMDAAAASDLSVLISGGEPVARKTLAHRIHRQSCNADGRFVIVEPDTFADMFARCADVGPSAARPLPPGTLLIEEVAAWDLAQQTQLMRFLEWMNLRGGAGANARGTRATRLISGTSHWLMDRVASKQFREDLFYRLNVIHLVLPDTAIAR
jgi:transcriptional regulator of acetoin/glycerol metabolism